MANDYALTKIVTIQELIDKGYKVEKDGNVEDEDYDPKHPYVIIRDKDKIEAEQDEGAYFYCTRKNLCKPPTDDNLALLNTVGCQGEGWNLIYKICDEFGCDVYDMDNDDEIYENTENWMKYNDKFKELLDIQEKLTTQDISNETSENYMNNSDDDGGLPF